MPKKIPVSKFLVLFDPPEKLQYIRTPPNVRQVCQKLLVPNLYELILRHIIDILGKKFHGKISRWEIATALRIHPNTVSKGVRFLSEIGLLEVFWSKDSGDAPDYAVPIAREMRKAINKKYKEEKKFQDLKTNNRDYEEGEG